MKTPKSKTETVQKRRAAIKRAYDAPAPSGAGEGAPRPARRKPAGTGFVKKSEPKDGDAPAAGQGDRPFRPVRRKPAGTGFVKKSESKDGDAPGGGFGNRPFRPVRRKPAGTGFVKKSGSKDGDAPRPDRGGAPRVKERKTVRPGQVEDAFADRPASETDGSIRLNKYIAMSGKCSRRDADKLILDGKVSINGRRVEEPGVQVQPGDVVEVSGQTIAPEPMAYLMLHKPKNTITTVEDDQGRATVTDIIRQATPLRVFPVGRLDRNTSGLLLFTNDGELSNRLLHPRYKVEKVYKFDLAAPLTGEQERQLTAGVKLEDGIARGYFLQQMDPERLSFKIGVHEGRNHLIRRMLEGVGAKILRLKRTDFANMKLGEMKPGEWRFLTEEEVNKLRKSVDLAPLQMKA